MILPAIVLSMSCMTKVAIYYSVFCILMAACCRNYPFGEWIWYHFYFIWSREVIRSLMVSLVTELVRQQWCYLMSIENTLWPTRAHCKAISFLWRKKRRKKGIGIDPKLTLLLTIGLNHHTIKIFTSHLMMKAACVNAPKWVPPMKCLLYCRYERCSLGEYYPLI